MDIRQILSPAGAILALLCWLALPWRTLRLSNPLMADKVLNASGLEILTEGLSYTLLALIPLLSSLLILTASSVIKYSQRKLTIIVSCVVSLASMLLLALLTPSTTQYQLITIKPSMGYGWYGAFLGFTISLIATLFLNHQSEPAR